MKKIIAILLTLAMMTVVFANVSIVTAKQTGQNIVQDIVWTGDQVINTAMTQTNQVIWVTGNITIASGGSLTLVNSTIVMNCSISMIYYIEVQSGGTLIVRDNGDGFNAMHPLDSDASVITSNGTNNYNFWIDSGSTVTIMNSIIEEFGNNTDIPPNKWGGIYIRSSSVTLEDSLFQGGDHALLFDSCYPLSFARNNVSNNVGIGYAIINAFTQTFNITYALANNNLIGNGMHAALFSGQAVNVEVRNMNISDNAYGVNVYGDRAVNLNVHDNQFWGNSGSSEQNAATVFAITNDTSDIDVKVERNMMVDNNPGNVWIGYDWTNDMRAASKVTALMANNTLIANHGRNRFQAVELVDAKIVDNTISYTDGDSKMDAFRFGYGQDSSPGERDNFTERLVLDFSRNNVDMGMYSDGVNIGGFVRTAAKQKMAVTIEDNRILGGYEVGGLFNIGYPSAGGSSGGFDWTDPLYPVVKNATAHIEGNNVRMLYDPRPGGGNPDVGGVFGPVIASENLNATIIGNYFYGTGDNIGMICRVGWWGSSYMDPVKNLTTTIEDNIFIVNIEDASCGVGAQNVEISAQEEAIALVEGNYFEFTDPPNDGSRAGGFINIGLEESPGYECKNVTADIIDNTIVGTITGGGVLGGVIWALGIDNTIVNITGNDITLTTLGDTSGCTPDIGGVLKIGHSFNNGYLSKRVIATVNENTILANFGYNTGSVGGAVRISGEDYTEVMMNDNVIKGIWPPDPGSESSYDDFGVRIGYQCYSQGIISENTTVTMSNNVIGPGAKNSALAIGANNNVTFSIDGGQVRGARYGNCGGTGSFGTQATYGNGITLLAENCIDATIRNVEIFENRGSGIFIESVESSTVDIENCNIHENYWHGIYMVSQNGVIDASGSIKDTQIIDNGINWHNDLPELGSGIYCSNAIIGLDNSTLDNPNGQYELELMGESNVTALNTTFNKNSVYIEGLTSGTFVGTQWAENDYTEWAAISDGSFRINIDGDVQNIDAVDFVGDLNMDDVASTIQTAIQAVGTGGYAGATCIWNTDHFEITSGTSDVSSQVSALATSTGTVGTDISGHNASANGYWMSCTNGTVTKGTGSWLLVEWYMHVKSMVQGTPAPLPSAAFTVSDVYGPVGSDVTGLDGYRRNFIVEEYLSTTDYTTTYTPHIVAATKGVSTGSAGPIVMDASKEVIVELNYVSLPPVANAGADQPVEAGVNFTLDGSASTDDFWIVSWEWTNSSANISLSGETVNGTISALGVFDILLTVTDVEGYTDTDTVRITVLDSADPVANAGPDQTVDEDTAVTFDGTGSSDNIWITNYTWTFNDGTSVSIYGFSPIYTFHQPGTYIVTLTVSDESGNTATDIVVITVLDVTAPTVDAGLGQTVAQGTTVLFDGSASSDNVGISTYIWTFNDGANSIVLTGEFVNYTFTLLGNRTVTLTCTDTAGNSAAGSTWINIVDQDPPVILVVAPGESLTGVPIDWSLIIVFDEPMDTASVEGVFSITGASAADFTWDSTNRYVTIEFSALAYGTTYTFTMGTNATDVAGNHLATAYTGTFTTITEPQQPAGAETGFFMNNWWILVVIIVVLAVLLLVMMLRGGLKKPVQAAPEQPAAPEAPAEPEETEEIK